MQQEKNCNSPLCCRPSVLLFSISAAEEVLQPLRLFLNAAFRRSRNQPQASAVAYPQLSLPAAVKVPKLLGPLLLVRLTALLQSLEEIGGLERLFCRVDSGCERNRKSRAPSGFRAVETVRRPGRNLDFRAKP